MKSMITAVLFGLALTGCNDPVSTELKSLTCYSGGVIILDTRINPYVTEGPANSLVVFDRNELKEKTLTTECIISD